MKSLFTVFLFSYLTLPIYAQNLKSTISSKVQNIDTLTLKRDNRTTYITSLDHVTVKLKNGLKFKGTIDSISVGKIYVLNSLERKEINFQDISIIQTNTYKKGEGLSMIAGGVILSSFSGAYLALVAFVDLFTTVKPKHYIRGAVPLTGGLVVIVLGITKIHSSKNFNFNNWSPVL